MTVQVAPLYCTKPRELSVCSIATETAAAFPCATNCNEIRSSLEIPSRIWLHRAHVTPSIEAPFIFECPKYGKSVGAGDSVGTANVETAVVAGRDEQCLLPPLVFPPYLTVLPGCSD